jgi:hypothetical protein
MAEPMTPRLSNDEFRNFIMTPRAGGKTGDMSKSAFAKPNNDARMSLFYFTITSSF